MAIIDGINKDGIFTLANNEKPKLDNIFSLPATKRVPMLGLDFEEFYQMAGADVANLEGNAYLVLWGFTQYELLYKFNTKSSVLEVNLMEVIRE